jgi:hypothetical protein
MSASFSPSSCLRGEALYRFMPVLANMCFVSFMLRHSNENTTIMGRTGSEMEELGAAFTTIAFQNKPCMLI